MAQPDTKTIEHVVICGAGLAAQMTEAAFASQLPASVKITLLTCKDTSDTDLFYGGVTAPSAYAFNLSAGVSEPRLIMDSDTAFSWGTNYVKWGGDRSWLQCFHLQLPILSGVLFHHYLARLSLDRIEPFLAPAMAARTGAFAHPTAKGPQPLSRAEYGYQFDPQSYARLFESPTDRDRVKAVVSTIREVQRGEQGISALHLADGQSITADLYVDCTGPDALLLSHTSPARSGKRHLRAAASRRAVDRLGAPYRTLTAETFGWQAETPLQQSLMRLTIYHPDSEAQALAAHGETPERTAEAALGARPEAWIGNCVAIGHAAAVVEPLTPAPMMLLERDIERVLSLIPVTDDMRVERREFNRRFTEDYAHAELFNRALLETEHLPEEPYWRAARSEPMPAKLARKLEQFESRGLLVAFDLEPFNAEDWTILHYGMCRRPSRHDRFADEPPEAQVRQHLENMRREIESLVQAMPSHDAYMTGLRRYLTQKRD